MAAQRLTWAERRGRRDGNGHCPHPLQSLGGRDWLIGVSHQHHAGLRDPAGVLWPEVGGGDRNLDSVPCRCCSLKKKFNCSVCSAGGSGFKYATLLSVHVCDVCACQCVCICRIHYPVCMCLCPHMSVHRESQGMTHLLREHMCALVLKYEDACGVHVCVHVYVMRMCVVCMYECACM